MSVCGLTQDIMLDIAEWRNKSYLCNRITGKKSSGYVFFIANVWKILVDDPNLLIHYSIGSIQY